MKRIVWLREASRERADIARRIREENSRAARRVVTEIKIRTSRLGDTAFIGRPGRVPNTRELSISRTPYIVIYRVTEEAVYILRVLHARQQWPAADRAPVLNAGSAGRP